MDKSISNYSLISGFWIWIILIIDGNGGTDLLDEIIKYVSKLS